MISSLAWSEASTPNPRLSFEQFLDWKPRDKSIEARMKYSLRSSLN